MIKRWFWPLAVMVVLSFAVFQWNAWSVEEPQEKKIEEKLDQILENQGRLFQRLDEIQEQLRIIKVRAS